MLIEVDYVDEIPRFTPPGQGEDFVRCGIPKVESVTELRVFLDWKKAEGRIEDPLQTQALASFGYFGALKCWLIQKPTYLESMRVERYEICLCALSHTLCRILKQIHVLGETGRLRCSINDRTAANVAVRVAIACQRLKDTPLQLS